VVERSPEKAGVGGSTPSRGTTFSSTYGYVTPSFGSIWFQNNQSGSPKSVSNNQDATRVLGSLPLEMRSVVVIETYASQRDLAEEYLKISLFKPYFSLVIRPGFLYQLKNSDTSLCPDYDTCQYTE
jgi:hypothetical protein